MTFACLLYMQLMWKTQPLHYLWVVGGKSKTCKMRFSNYEKGNFSAKALCQDSFHLIHEEKCNSVLILYYQAQTHCNIYLRENIWAFSSGKLIQNFTSELIPIPYQMHILSCTHMVTLCLKLSWPLSNLCWHQRSWIPYLLAGMCVSEL